MKDNKGFTLVELLAVIAILAILVIISLPNVMGMFNEAKKNSFTTEVKQIYKQAQQEWISDSMFNTSEQTYSRCKTCTGKSLDLTGRSELEYYIKINKAGNVVEYYITDGTYQYKYDGDGLKVEDIKDIKDIARLNYSEIIDMSDYSSIATFCVVRNGEKNYFNYEKGMTWSQYLESSYNTDFAEYSYDDIPRGIVSTLYNKTGVCGTDMVYEGNIQTSSEIIRSNVGCYTYINPGPC